MTITPTVLVAEPGRELRWLGRVGVPGVVDGEHYFLIEPSGPGRVHLTQGEEFRGAAVPLARGLGLVDVRAEFAAMNAALKTRAER